MGFAYLDIETSWEKTITIIGIHKSHGEGIIQLVAPEITPERLLDVLDGVETVFTYNGARFDLPVIHLHTGIDVISRWAHRDLMHECWKNNLKGGLKRIEQRLGIHRESEGLNGLDAMKLWKAWTHQGHQEALDILLQYNREDCENLEILAWKLGIVPAENVPVTRYVNVS